MRRSPPGALRRRALREASPRWRASAAARKRLAMRAGQPAAEPPQRPARGAAVGRSCEERAWARRRQRLAQAQQDEPQAQPELRGEALPQRQAVGGEAVLRWQVARAEAAQCGPRLPAVSSRESPSRRRRRGAPATSRSSVCSRLRGAPCQPNRRGPSECARGHVRLRPPRWNWSAFSSRSRQLRSELPEFPGS